MPRQLQGRPLRPIQGRYPRRPRCTALGGPRLEQHGRHLSSPCRHTGRLRLLSSSSGKRFRPGHNTLAAKCSLVQEDVLGKHHCLGAASSRRTQSHSAYLCSDSRSLASVPFIVSIEHCSDFLAGALRRESGAQVTWEGRLQRVAEGFSSLSQLQLNESAGKQLVPKPVSSRGKNRS